MCNDGGPQDTLHRSRLSSSKEPLLFPVEGSNYSDPFENKLSASLATILGDPWKQEIIPVVQFYQRPGNLPCGSNHYIYRNLKQARTLNPLVYFIGPEECKAMAAELDIILEPYSSFQNVIGWFNSNVGRPIGYQVRWFVLRAFMERHAFSRVFYTDSDVALFANISQLVPMLYPRTHLALAVRWPSLRPPMGPSQYASTAVSGHVSLWSHAALEDFTNFFRLFFERAVLFGKGGDRSLVEHRAYNDMVVLGWYTFPTCWSKAPAAQHPPCVSDKQSGVTEVRSARLRGRFRPLFKAESLCEPRWCNASLWVDEGWCVFDNNFSVQTPRQFFRFRPEQPMKCPTSMHYTHFEDWAPSGQAQTSPVQFLGVHFQAHKKGYISRADDPAATWGSAED